MSRRAFLSAAGAIGLNAGAASALWPGPARSAPRRGGHFRLAIGAGETGDSLNPWFLYNSSTQFTAGSLHNCLTVIDEQGRLQPELAVSWEVSDDVRTWTFKLRDGVEFHNGKTLTAEDVVASLNYHRGPDSQSTVAGIVAPITEVRADGDDTVVVVLEGGNADFAYVVSDFRLAIMPSEDGAVLGEGVKGTGCGAYVLKSFEPGVRIELERHANYWKSDRAWFETIGIDCVTDTVARTNALLTGEYDAIDRCELKTIEQLKARDGIEVVSVTGTQHYTLPMNTDLAPFDDNEVRLALKHGIDREELLRTVLKGYGRLGNDHPIGPSNRYFAADLAQRQYDPDRAKFHLEKAGLSELKVDLHTSDAAFAGAVDAAVLYQNSAAKAGIDINVVREPADGYWSGVWMNKPWCFSYWGGRPTEDWMFSSVYSAEAKMNESFWENERFETLLAEARVTLDEERRAAMYAEMQEIVRDDGGSVIPLFANYVNAFTGRVGHGEIAANWDLDGFRGAERWWFEDAS